MRMEIKCDSPLMLGSGSGRGSFIDSDIIFDKYGIPFFPARRLKGLLRESAVEVEEMLQQAGLEQFFSSQVVDKVFGNAQKRAAIRINNLFLENYVQVVEGLRYAHQEFPLIINKESVMNAYTDIRQQTAIENGIAREHSLRTIRVLNSGYKFVGTIEFLDMEGQEEVRALLVLAGLNLKRAGRGRNRGWGEIFCRLYSDDNEDLGQKYLNQLKRWDKTKQHKMAEIKNEPGVKSPTVELPSTSTFAYTHKLPYFITNTAPLLFTAPEGDENMVNSLDYIPGNALLGYFANQFIRRNMLDPEVAQNNINFKQWFLDGALCFGNAYLAYSAYSEADSGPYPLYPTPLFLHTDKQRQEIIDVTWDEADDTLGEMEVIGGYCRLINGALQKKQPEKNINFHLVRNSASERSRKRIEGHGDDGGIYHYESLTEGQIFHGYVLGSRETLRAFSDCFGIESEISDLRIHLGRSLSTQYGSSRIEFSGIAKHEPSIDDSLIGEANTDVCLDQDRVLLYLLSPLVLNNRLGFLGACEEEELLAALKDRLGIEEVTIEKSFARVETRSTFVSRWKMHEPSFKCWTAGSSFLLHLSGGIEPEIEEKLTLLMQEGLGEKRHQGYGQIRFIRHHLTEINGFYNETVIRAQEVRPAVFSLAVRGILEAIRKEGFERIVTTAAALRAREYYDANSPNLVLSSNLLGRLETMVKASTSPQDLSDKTLKLRKPARERLEKMRLREQTLCQDLTASGIEDWCRAAAIEQCNLLMNFTQFLYGRNNQDNSLDYEPQYKAFWQVFFRTLRKLYKLGERREARA